MPADQFEIQWTCGADLVPEMKATCATCDASRFIDMDSLPKQLIGDKLFCFAYFFSNRPSE